MEPIQPPNEPLHILSQQVLALSLQESGIGRQNWFDWISDVSAFSSLDKNAVEYLITWMLDKEILFEDQGILGIGRQGEDSYGRRNFLDILSVFLSPPVFTVLFGKDELGYIDERTFMQKDRGDTKVVLLGGRAWRVKHIDWKRRRVFVEPTDAEGGARWMGEGSSLSFAICQAMKEVLVSPENLPEFSQRARQRISSLQSEFPWLEDVDCTYIVHGKRIEWWTFAGAVGNALISSGLQATISDRVKSDDLKIVFPDRCALSDAESAIEEVTRREKYDLKPTIDPNAIDGLKFSDILPEEYAIRVIQSRLVDHLAVETILRQRALFIVTQ